MTRLVKNTVHDDIFDADTKLKIGRATTIFYDDRTADVKAFMPDGRAFQRILRNEVWSEWIQLPLAQK